MSLNDAHAFAFSLATTLMVAIIVFQAGDGSLGVMPANEYDGDTAAIVPPPLIFGYIHHCAAVVVEARPFDPLSRRPPS